MEPFRHRRRVGFGECDPARIFFAPRAIDYAVEAAEAFSAEVLGAPWAAPGPDGREAKVLAFDCTYERSIAAGEEVELSVAPRALGADRLLLGAVAELSPGVVSFRTELALAFVDRGGAEPRPLPAPILERLRGEALPPPPSPPAATHAAPPGSRFTRTHRVRYGDCGPAGDVYAPRVADWAVEAAGAWYEATLGVSWIEQCRRGRGTPFLQIRCELPGRMAPGRLVTMDVAIPRLGKASIAYAVSGRGEAGEPLFRADMSACYITEEAGPPRSMPFPDALRERILAFQAGAGAPGRS